MRSTDLRRFAGSMLAAAVCVVAVGPAAPAGRAGAPPKAGKIIQIQDFVWINGKLAHGTRNVSAGTVVKTLSLGQARIEMKALRSTCTNAADVRLVVAPRPRIVLQLISGDLVCTMIAGKNCGKHSFKAGPATISSCDPAFAMLVEKGKTVVKVTRGFVVVTGAHGRRAAVLVARNRQVIVQAGHDPHATTPAVLSPREKRAFAMVLAGKPASHDTTPPAARITGEPPRATARLIATFAFAAGERNVAFACSLDGGPFHVCTSPTTYRGLAPRTHTFTVTATDAAGNTAPAGAYSWTIDNRPPVAKITSQQSVATSATSATFTFTADESSVTFTCQLDRAAFAPCSSPATFAGLLSGAHSFTVRATDAAGNVGAPATLVTWTVDARAPAVTVSSDKPALTNATSVTFTFGADKSPVSFACQFDSGGLAPCASPKAYSGLAEGTHTFLVRATDAVGNVGTTKYAWTIDLTRPIVTITSKPPDPEWIPSTGSGSASFTFTASESGVTFTCRLDTSAPAACGSPKSYTGLKPGQHTFSVTPTDAAGNVGRPAAYTWTINVIPS